MGVIVSLQIARVYEPKSSPCPCRTAQLAESLTPCIMNLTLSMLGVFSGWVLINDHAGWHSITNRRLSTQIA